MTASIDDRCKKWSIHTRPLVASSVFRSATQQARFNPSIPIPSRHRGVHLGFHGHSCLSRMVGFNRAGCCSAHDPHEKQVYKDCRLTSHLGRRACSSLRTCADSHTPRFFAVAQGGQGETNSYTAPLSTRPIVRLRRAGFVVSKHTCQSSAGFVPLFFFIDEVQSFENMSGI